MSLVSADEGGCSVRGLCGFIAADDTLFMAVKAAAAADRSAIFAPRVCVFVRNPSSMFDRL